MNDEQYLLASAYVDGDITDDERQIAERDPAVMSEVAAIRAARAAVADVPTASENTKRAAIAAAMAEFQPAAPPASASPAEPTPAPERVAPIEAARSRRSMRWLQIAAVAAGVGLAGLVVSRGIGNIGGDDDSAISESAAVEPADEPAEEPADDGDFDRATAEAVDPADIGDDADAVEAPAAAEAAEEPAEEAADEASTSADATVGDDMAASAADESADADAGSAELDLAFAEGGYSARLDLALVGRNGTQPITTEEELIEFGRAVSAAAASNLPAPELPVLGECEFDEPVLADAFVDVGDGPVLALIGIDDRLLIIRAYDPETCFILLEV